MRCTSSYGRVAGAGLVMLLCALLSTVYAEAQESEEATGIFVVTGTIYRDSTPVEEGLHVRIVITIASPAHAVYETILLGKVDKIIICELPSLICMYQKPLFRLARCYGLLQCPDTKLTVSGGAGGPSDDLTRVQIHYCREKQPSPPGPDVGHIHSFGMFTPSPSLRC